MTQTFPHWLADQKDRDDEVGSLAREIGQRSDFPDSGGKSIFDGYFESETDSDRESFERAWMEFDAHPEPSTTSKDPDGLS